MRQFGDSHRCEERPNEIVAEFASEPHEERPQNPGRDRKNEQNDDGSRNDFRNGYPGHFREGLEEARDFLFDPMPDEQQKGHEVRDLDRIVGGPRGRSDPSDKTSEIADEEQRCRNRPEGEIADDGNKNREKECDRDGHGAFTHVVTSLEPPRDSPAGAPNLVRMAFFVFVTELGFELLIVVFASL